MQFNTTIIVEYIILVSRKILIIFFPCLIYFHPNHCFIILYTVLLLRSVTHQVVDQAVVYIHIIESSQQPWDIGSIEIV